MIEILHKVSYLGSLHFNVMRPAPSFLSKLHILGSCSLWPKFAPTASHKPLTMKRTPRKSTSTVFESYLRPLELMKPSPGLWNIGNHVNPNAIWWAAENTDLTQSTKREYLLAGVVLWTRLSNYDECSCAREFLKPQRALKLLRSLDGAVESNNSDSVWIFADECESSIEPSLLLKSEEEIRAKASATKNSAMSRSFEHPCNLSENSQRGLNMNAFSNKLATPTPTAHFVCEVFNIVSGMKSYIFSTSQLEHLNCYLSIRFLRSLESSIQLSKASLSGPEGYVQSLHEISIPSLLDWFAFLPKAFETTFRASIHAPVILYLPYMTLSIHPAGLNV